MNINILESAWQKQAVVGGGEPGEKIAVRVDRDIAVAQRRIRGGIVLVIFVLFLGWIMTITAHLTSIKPITPIALLAQVVNTILFVLFLIRALHSARAVRNEKAMMGGTMRESVSATLRTVELQMENARIAAYAIPAVGAINAWLCVAKFLAGDLPYVGAAVGSLFMAVFGAVIGGIVWYRYRTYLAPRRKELQKMSQAFDEHAPGAS